MKLYSFKNNPYIAAIELSEAGAQLNEYSANPNQRIVSVRLTDLGEHHKFNEQVDQPVRSLPKGKNPTSIDNAFHEDPKRIKPEDRKISKVRHYHFKQGETETGVKVTLGIQFFIRNEREAFNGLLNRLEEMKAITPDEKKEVLERLWQEEITPWERQQWAHRIAASEFPSVDQGLGI